MNKKLLPFWILFAGINIFLSIKFYHGANQELGLIYALTGLFGIVMIFEIIRKHKDFKLTGDNLIIRQMLRPERKLNLGQLQSWTENNFYFHGQVNRKLILKTRDSDKLTYQTKTT